MEGAFICKVFIIKYLLISICLYNINYLKLPISLPSISSFVKLKLYDFDSGKKDELVGSMYFEIKDIQEGKVNKHNKKDI